MFYSTFFSISLIIIFALIQINLCCDCTVVFCINILQTLFNDSTVSVVFSLLLQYFYRDVFTVHVVP